MEDEQIKKIKLRFVDLYRFASGNKIVLINYGWCVGAKWIIFRRWNNNLHHCPILCLFCRTFATCCLYYIWWFDQWSVIVSPHLQTINYGQKSIKTTLSLKIWYWPPVADLCVWQTLLWTMVIMLNVKTQILFVNLLIKII